MAAHRMLDPRPVGWFAVGLSRDLKPGQSLTGILCAAPFKLSRGVDGNLHHSGSITATSEQNGFILAWHHPHGQAPDWQVPVLDEGGWRPLLFRQMRVRSHPQETFENSIDMAHFPKVHGFSEIQVLQAPAFTEHSMAVRYRIVRRHPLPFVGKPITPSFEVRIHGIGIAHNHIELPDFGMRVRMFALSTPTEPGYVDIRLGVSIPTKLPFPGFLAPLVHWSFARNIHQDFCQDIAIWESKLYQAPPLLVRGDGPIARFRQWCARYYLSEDAAAQDAQLNRNEPHEGFATP